MTDAYTKTYFDKIKETIQEHPEIPPPVIADILCRCRDYLEEEYGQETSKFIQRQYDYLLLWIK